MDEQEVSGQHQRGGKGRSVLLLTQGLVALVVIAGLIYTPGFTPQLTVRTLDTKGNIQSGFYMALSQGGKVVATGFSGSSDTFALKSGEQYSIQVDDYGSCHFARWADTNSTNPLRVISILSNTQLDAVYACNENGITSQLTVESTDLAGRPVSGLVIGLSLDGSVVDSGTSPQNLNLTRGQTYLVQLYDSGSFDSGPCRFDHWNDTGSTSTSRTINVTGNTQLTAVYACLNSSSVTINSVDQSGKLISGYYVVLYDSNGSIAANGFTTKTFPTENGNSYMVLVNNFGSCQFVRWSDGNTTNPRSFTAGNSSITFTAVFGCTA